MIKILKIKKGIDINIAGAVPEGTAAVDVEVQRVALIPDDFVGITPKLDVKPDDEVEAGQPLWHDKTRTDIKVVSPVAGRVVEVVRGEKRKLLRVVVETHNSKKTLVRKAFNGMHGKDELMLMLKHSGLWAMMRQLPFDIVPCEDHTPANIFISAWDSAPLATGYQLYLNNDNLAFLQKGVSALSTLTTGRVYVGCSNNNPLPELADAVTVEIEGRYPASLPSVLAANTAPVNKGQTCWLMGAETAVRLGQLLSGQAIDWQFPVAVTGSEVEKPCIVNACPGSQVTALLKTAAVKPPVKHQRIISGNVLVGHHISDNGYLRFPYRQITVIPEGDDVTEFMGWASMSPSKMSLSRSFPAFFRRKHTFTPDARLNGGRRSMIMSGEYDRYIPMDIMAEYLLKAIIARDIERMEQLGIYEVTPADFSAAEYADTSKLELQKIVRQGLDYMIKEVGIAE